MRRALILLALVGCGTKVVDLAPLDAGADKQPIACAIQMINEADRCLYCKGATYEQVACLKCVEIDPASGCTECYWGDMPKDACKMCPDANGKPQWLGCDELRPEIPNSN
jgi:hypothetical protein